MLYCNKCKVTVSGNPDFCPLCQGELSGKAESGASFPNIKHKKNYFSLYIKFAAMLSIAGICVCAAINYSEYDSLLGWWLYVMGGVISFWLTFGVAVSRRGNVTKSIIFTTIVVCAIALVWDIFTGYKGWSLDYFLPIACCTTMLAMAIIARVLNLRIEDYIYYMIIDIIFGIVPLILVICGAVGFKVLSIACVAASIISLAALLLFEGKALRAEIIRRTHL